MWVSHLSNRYNVVLMLQLLCVLPENIIDVRAHVPVCEVGQDMRKGNVGRWVLSNEGPCQCRSVRFGGFNVQKPARPFQPKYVNKPWVRDDVKTTRHHCNLNGNVISSPDACEPSLFIENCPADFTHQEPAFCGTVPVVWTEPSATDGCDGIVRVKKTHAPGAEFSVGTTTVSYTFMDSLQNQQTCEFDVSVSVIRVEDDSIGPVISNCPEHIYEVLEPGQTTVDIWWGPPRARDGSGLPVTVQQTHSPGDQFTVGGYELVKYTFTDAAGNEAVCEFAVTVYPNGATADTVPPTVRGCGNTVKVYATTGSTSADYDVVWPTATDNDGQTPVRIATHQPGIESFPLGRTLIDAYYYDTSGNRARCHRS
ncbi:hyalin-like [Amphiura filiformis]|uniref:hyalin-like n=1 Tax=Amphiura filiformis TaxID=82378 RepID=UPI003B215106